jgi:hypothetical protein
MTTKTTINRLSRIILPMCAVILLFWAGTGTAAAEDDFSNIVHHIESRYHTHRNLRFLMGFAGLAAKTWPGTGVRGVKIALFEDPRVFHSAPDRELEELMQSLGNSGWQQMVKSVSPRSNEHTYVYAKPVGGKFKLLIVVVDNEDTAVVQANVDLRSLDDVINDHSRKKRHHHGDATGAGGIHGSDDGYASRDVPEATASVREIISSSR